jgi:hypothetical protein
VISAWLDLSNLLAARLVDKLRLERLRGPVIAVHSQHLTDPAPACLTLDMNDVIDCLAEEGLHSSESGIERRLRQGKRREEHQQGEEGKTGQIRRRLPLRAVWNRRVGVRAAIIGTSNGLNFCRSVSEGSRAFSSVQDFLSMPP